MNNNLLSNTNPVIAVIDPDAYAAGTYTSGWIDMSLYGNIQAIMLLGDMGNNGTVDFKIQEATDSSGTGAQDISGKAITQIDEAATSPTGYGNKQAVINLEESELTVNSDYRYVRMSMTVATAASDAGAIAIVGNADTLPVTDATTVVEVIS